MSIVSELKDKRVVLGLIGPRGQIETHVATIMDVDEKFIKFKTDLTAKKDKYDVAAQYLVTYVNINTVDSVVDASNDEIYEVLLSSIRTARMQQMQQLAEMQKKMEAEKAGSQIKIVDEQ